MAQARRAFIRQPRREQREGADRGAWERTGSKHPHPSPATPPVFCNGSHCASVAEQGIELSVSYGKRGGGQPYLLFTRGDLWESQRGEWEDLLEDGGLKLSELGSWSPSVALGSDVAISPLVVELELGNNSAANKTGCGLEERPVQA